MSGLRLYGNLDRVKGRAYSLQQGAVLVGEETEDPASLDDGVGETLSMTVVGARLGDAVIGIAPPYSLQGITCSGYVSASDTVQVRLQNETTGTINLASGTWRVAVLKLVNNP